MSQTKYWVLKPDATVRTEQDATGQPTKIYFYAGDVVCTAVLDENEIFDPPPSIRHGIETQGWRVVQRVLPPSGLNDMGSVDWKSVAEGLAMAMEALLEQSDLDDPEPAEQAGRAMDGYHIAVAEEHLHAGPEVIEMSDDDEGADGRD